MSPPSPRRLRLGLFSAATAFASLLSSPATALDILTLESGGVIQGDWLNRDEQPLTHYRVRTTSGLVVSLQLTQVRQTTCERPASAEYQQLLPTFRDTPSDQWKLAEWCRNQQLMTERNRHLLRILELDDQHPGARRALGFVQVDNQWIRHADLKRGDGYELYKGRWRTIQEIELLEVTAKRELAERDWLQKIRRWRRELDTERAREAAEQLVKINDSVAIGPLIVVLKEDRNRRAKMLFCDIIAAQANGTGENAAVVQALVATSLTDPDEEIFHHCLEHILKLKPPHVADTYVKALQDSDNVKINRAGIALGRIGDRSAIAPLIAALVTTHTKTVGSTARGSGDTISQSFGSNGTSFKSAEGPKTYVYRVQNQHVLDGLTQLARGVSFGFDAKAWQYWHAQEKQSLPTTDPGVRD